MMIEIIWPDGTRTSGETWTELEQAMRAEQWDAYGSRREFRQDMRRRAEVWSGEKVPLSILVRTPKKFITALAEDYDMFTLEVSP